MRRRGYQAKNTNTNPGTKSGVSVIEELEPVSVPTRSEVADGSDAVLKPLIPLTDGRAVMSEC